MRVVYCITSVSDRFSNLKRFFFSNKFSLRKTVSSSLSFSSSSSAVKLCVKDSTWASSLVDDVPSVDKKSFLRGLFLKGSSARAELFVFLTFLEPSSSPRSYKLGIAFLRSRFFLNMEGVFSFAGRKSFSSKCLLQTYVVFDG